MWLLTPMMRIYYPFFIILMILGLLIAMSSNSWLITWIGLEINLYTFIPLILHSNMQKRKEAAAKYFIAQATGSALLLAATLSLSSFPLMSSMLFICSLLLKGGLAPMHFWFPSTMAISSWFSCFLMTTIQKLAPVSLLISMFPMNSQIMLMLGSLMALIGGLSGMNQTQLRAILAYSSIGQMGWIIVATQSSFLLSMIMIINYMITVTAMMMILSYMEWTTNNESNMLWGYKKLTIFLLFILLINLSGIPPFPGFFFKAMVIMKLASISAMKTSMLLIMGSILSLYFYLKIMFNSLFSISNKKFINEMYLNTTLNIMIITISSISIFILFFMIPWI